MYSRLFRGRSPPPLAIALVCFAVLLFSVSFLQPSSFVWPPQQAVKPFDEPPSAEIISSGFLVNQSTTCSAPVKDIAEEWAPHLFLKGAPTRKVKGCPLKFIFLSLRIDFFLKPLPDNLLDNAHYITTFSNAGLSKILDFSTMDLF